MDSSPDNSEYTIVTHIRARMQLDTRWKLRNELHRFLIVPLVRYQFMVTGIPWKRGWRLYGVPIMQKHRKSVIRFGENLNLRSTSRSNPLSPNHPVVISTRTPNAILIIGDNFGMTGGSIVVDTCVEIGNNVNVGANTIICDTDFHPLSSVERLHAPNVGKSSPIFIQDNVFIGMQCLILKGVTIGQCSVVAAGSVVTRDVPPGVVVAGNPARTIREL